MFLRHARIPSRRIAGAANSSLRIRNGAPIATATIQKSFIFSPKCVAPITSARTYANGRPHPPGGTHRMDLGGGGEEKSALEQYGVDLTARAKDGKLDPVIGRDAEIHRTIQVLSRRTKNNPVLIG